MKRTILQSIRDEVDKIHWSKPLARKEAMKLCQSIWGLYTLDGGDFWQWQTLSHKYFTTIVRSKTIVEEVRKKLLEHGILENKNTYNVAKGIAKPYRFTEKIIRCNDFVSYDSREKNNEIPIPLHKFMPGLTFDPVVWNWIEEFSISDRDIITGSDIEDEYMDVRIVKDEKTGRFRRDTALKLAESEGLELIKWRRSFYIDDLDLFRERKEVELKKIYSHYVREIEEGSFRWNRNDTNRRLDYNLTNMKKELIDHLLWNGEDLVELDIANCQFAIIANIATHLDPLYVKLVKEGKLYSYVADKLQMTEKKAKEFIINITFDKIRKDHDKVREIFPMTMNFIDGWKKKFGWDKFSVYLQTRESSIMIDGLADRLVKVGYTIFPIHDAIRVPRSMKAGVMKIMKEYFDEIEFYCEVRVKEKKTVLER